MEGIRESEEYKKLNEYDAIMICEGVDEVDSEEEVIAAWQKIIDSGLVNSLQGFFGRTAQNLIDNGICLPKV